MIKKLIRKLFGQESADSNESAANDIPADSPDAKPARKSTRKKAAAPVKRDPNVPVILSSDIHGIDPSLISKNAVRVTDGLQHAGHRAFIVGGAVRDLLLGVAPKDFDVATDATPDQVQKLFRRARIIGRRFQIVHVQFGQDIIETSTFRALVDIPADAPPAEPPRFNTSATPVFVACSAGERPNRIPVASAITSVNAAVAKSGAISIPTTEPAAMSANAR